MSHYATLCYIMLLYVTLCYIMLHYVTLYYIMLHDYFRFWRALRSFDQTDRAKFLQFVTGSSKVPLQVHVTTFVLHNILNFEIIIIMCFLQGFGALEGMNGAQKFQIHRDDR